MTEDELFAQLEEEMQTMPCESPVHDRSPMHFGTGEWYVTYHCARCKAGLITVLCCDRANSLLPVMLQLSPSYVIECEECHNQFLSKELIISSEKRRP